MGLLHIRLFGRVRVIRDDGPEVKMTPTAQTLLAYILLRRAFCPRDVLACLCWGEHPDDHARSCLSTALWRLRRSLEAEEAPRGTYLLTTSSGEVGFNWSSGHWLDLAVFEAEASRALALPPASFGLAQAEALQRAISVYSGDLLEGFYDDWALRERERLRAMYLDSLQRLLAYHESCGAFDESLSLAHRLLAVDPLREDIHRQIMRLCVRTGQRALAVRQYNVCRDVLAEELGIRPMEETEALYHQIVQDAEEPRVPPGNDQAALPQAIHALRQAMREMENARGQLSRAVQLLEQVTPNSHSAPSVRGR